MNSATTFELFREELDAYNDRRERLIKTSRDITNLSKKLIFHLHRHLPFPPVTALSECHSKLSEIQNIFKTKVAVEVVEDYWRYERQIRGGLQEYIEALSFIQYIEHGSLISFDDVQKSISDKDTGAHYFPLTPSDYLLGLSDLTGELMRYAISSLSEPGGRQRALEICTFVRGCKSDFDAFTSQIRDLDKKQQVTGQSLMKIEDACYAVIVRESEYDPRFFESGYDSEPQSDLDGE